MKYRADKKNDVEVRCPRKDGIYAGTIIWTKIPFDIDKTSKSPGSF